MERYDPKSLGANENWRKKQLELTNSTIQLIVKLSVNPLSFCDFKKQK